MNAAASVTTDDGDKVNHGWSQLDIAKHSTNTFVSALSEDDFFAVVTYSDGANVLVDWTKCDDAGRERAITAIHSMRPERSTNLMAGITTGFSMFEKLPESDANLAGYALNLVITTDGMPSSQWHPARGRDGYAPLVKTLTKNLARKRGESARPVVTTIGIGFQLDSELLLRMSETFLHMPDPGQIGPFTVNLLAATRSTARLPEPSGQAANACAIIVSPADAVADNPFEGYESRTERVTDENGAPAYKLNVGPMIYDQPRSFLLKKPEDTDIKVSLMVGSTTILAKESIAASADSSLLKEAKITQVRVRAIQAIEEALAKGAANDPQEAVKAPLEAFLSGLRASPVASEPIVVALANTVQSECIMGCEPANFRRWGNHYFRTLPCMLRSQRRSNFRDECMQTFGQDALGREAMFEEQSNDAEMKFATLTPPEPSLLNPQPPLPAVSASAGAAAPPPTAPPPPRPMALPDEFMRGGGCFGPEARLTLVSPGGETRVTRICEVQAGDVVLGEGGKTARVECVVMTPCVGGRAMLTRMPNGLQITEWHPVRLPNGRWRFPNMIGERVVVRTPYVYNLVLPPGHPTVLVQGIPCAALGHGLDAPVVAHPYWGTRAVIDDLMGQEGWTEGRVILPASAAA